MSNIQCEMASWWCRLSLLLTFFNLVQLKVSCEWVVLVAITELGWIQCLIQQSVSWDDTECNATQKLTRFSGRRSPDIATTTRRCHGRLQKQVDTLSAATKHRMWVWANFTYIWRGRENPADISCHVTKFVINSHKSCKFLSAYYVPGMSQILPFTSIY